MNTGRIVARNAFVMLVSQIVTGVLSFIAVPLVTRWLGSAAYGQLWRAMSVAQFAAMAVECGQDTYVALAVARDKSRAREFLGSTLLVRLGMGAAVALPLYFILVLLRFDSLLRALVFIQYGGLVLLGLWNGVIAVIRGLENMRWQAAHRIATDTFHTALTAAVVWAGGQVLAVASVEIATNLFALIIVAIVAGRLRLWPERLHLRTARELIRGGSPFLLWAGVLALQPALESVILSKFVGDEVVGWYGAAVKLLNVLLFPAFILGGAIAPTLARLHATDERAFERASRESLRISLLLGAPVAIGTFLYADPAVHLVYGWAFVETASNLRVLALYAMPVFLNIALGSALMASGKELKWAIFKLAMVIGGAGVSFFFIPYFQAHFGNGGIGAAVVTAGAEFLMLGAALAMSPPGFTDAALGLDVLRICGAGALMVAVARLMIATPFIAAVVSVVAYCAGLFLTRAVALREIDLARHAIRDTLERR
jgi:O-antigen/teichoic acid export membrane protein